MNWVDHTIWWHVYPLGFCGAPIRGEHTAAPRLRRLLNWLDYAVELGASGLLLGPIFASEAHGYDTLDFYRIDPRLGTDEDFDDLVAGCRARGRRIGAGGRDRAGTPVAPRTHAPLPPAALPPSPRARAAPPPASRRNH